MQLKDKVVIVTGAGSGIGREIAIEFAKKGSKIVLADINQDLGRETLSIIKNDMKLTDDIMFIKCDVTQKHNILGLFKSALSEFGDIDVVINNAGIGGTINSYVHQKNSSGWELVNKVNIFGVIQGTQYAIQYFLEKQKPGVVINTASMGGLITMQENPVYALSKAAVVHLSRCLTSLSKDGIRVGAICPSFVDTPLVNQFGKKQVEMLNKIVGVLTPNYVAKAYVLYAELDETPSPVIRITKKRGMEYVQTKHSGTKVEEDPGVQSKL
eukprot:TRINITY_DN5619_c0_g1_i1.p1 TRINITY_DN5619_c0_g1~~TRINITY_DN5619_c0_g1_i1.p1  ORF type:complete len:269 (-),score=94.07 TRINITY_DN5619_c0_g1_i1:37-843(-)